MMTLVFKSIAVFGMLDVEHVTIRHPNSEWFERLLAQQPTNGLRIHWFRL